MSMPTNYKNSQGFRHGYDAYCNGTRKISWRPADWVQGWEAAKADHQARQEASRSQVHTAAAEALRLRTTQVK